MNSFNPFPDKPDSSDALVVGDKVVSGLISDRVREIASAGNVGAVYAAKCEKWFYRYVETRNATQSVIFAGFETTQPSWKGHQLVKKFRQLLMELTVVNHLGLEPLAMQRLGEVLEGGYHVPLVVRDVDGTARVALDEKGAPRMVPDAKIQANVIKAADSILDRGLLPKGLALKGTLPGVEGGGDKRDWKGDLDELVRHMGPEVVKGLRQVKDRPDMRAYLEEKYPIKVVNEQAKAPENGDVRDHVHPVDGE